ncbi:MAG: hypothetical protein A3B74_04155 [Candidatus Kerfeldbacteria bacterium RIFCSPHIGHO2_02_FULL_42_14]|uniref:Uncharacterized protein n=1 Tax=Candidatus Kerfeldbacteria bacterium RIFCSPHIGHO2_02_FULL_42_14 TaxID=1798540 RepID=A0A1G2AST4_9BACT|nr:MAG: hypothetical protein A3B74_04155 [Candidatus Kerfeldbacteria bacterium RIFCSPHIGHO2_02_FULL_42_14]OGY82627.1 MAG: hypothetical protein A3I91_04315 [Candidatus Kerfeldbacteria bacterium RIFCSPLOWO2_02_FULL_42_19]OGY85230.1 MAG: hypothetical protein A3G01_01445 [Candidatus Kerfeldbacteria bacterium RIFCSPLOWO2_12_FULL_43_9]
MVFTEGTITMHRNAAGHLRTEIIEQIKGEEPSVKEYESYIPIGDAVKKLTSWVNDGAEILYLTSRRKPVEIEVMRSVLKQYGFPDGQLLFRREGEEYKNVVERVMPNILIEDDCESIGGTEAMTITHVSSETKAKIKSISVPEFGGVDHLDDKISAP